MLYVGLDGPPAVINPLGVAVDRKGKKRLVVAACYINLFIRYVRFKYEGLRSVMSQLEAGDFMYTMDFKSGYHQVRKRQTHGHILSTSWFDSYW